MSVDPLRPSPSWLDPRRRGVLFLGLGTALTALADTTREATLREFHARFVQAQAVIDRAAIARLVETFESNHGDALIEEFVALLERRRNSGSQLIGEVIRKMAFFDARARTIAFLRVTTSYRHPMHPEALGEIHRTVHAFSRDAGLSWTFNVLDCVTQDALTRFAPEYAGFPSME